jgi:ABC-type lipoprotein release transport system permease subunit
MNSEEFITRIKQNENVRQVVPRLESFALGSSGPKTKGVIVMGIDPLKQDKMSKLSDKLLAGDYLEAGDQSVLVAKTLSDYLELGVNDTIVLLSQGYHGATAAGKYNVKGILEIPKPDLDNKMVYLPLSTAQQMYMAYDRLTTLSVNLNDYDELEVTVDELSGALNNDKYEVMSWKEIMPELVQQIESDNAGGWIMLAILYIIIAFGVFGTVMMMIVERRKEFGVMIAVGMHKFKLSIIVALEMLFIGLLGLLSGILGSIPVILYLHHNPIRLTGEVAESMKVYGIEPVMPLAWEAGYFVNQFVIVAVIVFVAIVYPVYSIKKITPVKAMRG